MDCIQHVVNAGSSLAMMGRDEEAAVLFERAEREFAGDEGVVSQARAMHVMLVHRNATSMVGSGRYSGHVWLI